MSRCDDLEHLENRVAELECLTDRVKDLERALEVLGGWLKSRGHDDECDSIHKEYGSCTCGLDVVLSWLEG